MAYADLAQAEAGWLLERASVPYLVIKGPSTRDVLAQPERPTGDADVLIEPSLRAAALAALGARGWRHEHAGTSEQETAGHSLVLQRPLDSENRTEVDLHVHFPGIEVPSDVAWWVLVRDAGTLDVAHRPLPVPSAAAALLFVVLHAARSALDVDKPLLDLRRALEVVPLSIWLQAQALAEELGATQALSAGLALTPEGRQRAHRLGVKPPTQPDWILRSRGDSSVSMFLLIWWRAPLLRKVPLLAREIWPTTAFLKLDWLGPEERGRFMVLRAHARRWRNLAHRLPPAVGALLSAQRTARTARQQQTAKPDES